MTVAVSRLAGVALVLIVVAAGVLIGRIIEAIAVAAVLFALWFSVRRMLSAPAEETGRLNEDRS